MVKWDSVFVNEMNHVYNRYMATKDIDTLNNVLQRVTKDENDFHVAFANGMIDYLKNNGVQVSVEPNISCILNPAVMPGLYYKPSFVSKARDYIDQSIPEFKSYGVIIKKIGDSA